MNSRHFHIAAGLLVLGISIANPAIEQRYAISHSAAPVNEPEVRAFLDVIAFAEGTAGEDGYQMVMGGSLFEDCSDHPRKSVPFADKAGRRNTSDAAGRYQFLSTTWDRVNRKLDLPDFCPESQDRGAIALLEENGAIARLRQGDFEGAVRSVRRVWASFPGAGYHQPEKSLESLRQVYEQQLALYEGGS